MATRNVTPFVDYVREECAKYGIAFILRPRMRDLGVFDYIKRTLTVNASGEDFYLVLAHEVGHLHQWVEHPAAFEAHSDGYDLFMEWLNGKRRLTARKVLSIVRRTQRMERDAEKRALRDIREWRLMDDTKPYVQDSNMYIWQYEIARRLGKWPALDTDQAAAMPTRLMPLTLLGKPPASLLTTG